MSDQASLSDVHNSAAKSALQAIIAPMIRAGGTTTDLLIVTESVVVGVFLMAVKLGGDEPVIDVFCDGVRQRLAEIRLGDVKTAGDA